MAKNKKYNFACAVNDGRILDCKDAIGGIQTIYLNVYDADLLSKLSFGTSSLVNQITDITSTPDVATFKFDLRPNTSSYTATMTSDPVQGTTYYEQVLEVVLQKIHAEDLHHLDTILKGRVQAWVLDANDNVFLLGTRFGLDVTAGAMSTGTAKADMSGFTLTFTGQETENYEVIQSAGVGTTNYPFDGLSPNENITITAGTY
tara:strand:- start:23 stop:631 length:609 start_codon:yes stop_codon:yes gene_type:complete